MTGMGKGILAIKKGVKGYMPTHSINQVEIGNHYTRMFALHTYNNISQIQHQI